MHHLTTLIDRILCGGRRSIPRQGISNLVTVSTPLQEIVEIYPGLSHGRTARNTGNENQAQQDDAHSAIVHCRVPQVRSTLRAPKNTGLIAWAILTLPLVLVALPLFLSSDNLHSAGESTTYDRIGLAIRTFWGHEGASFWAPGTWAIDHNFPLGTAFFFALPMVLKIDPVGVLRCHSVLWALVASLAMFRLLRPRVSPILAACAASAMWCVPTFVRGAVVTGEEAPTIGLMMLSLLWLSRTKAKPRSLLLSCLAVNGMVLFRLDAIFIPPVFALAAFWIVGGRTAIAYAIGCAGTTLLHLGVTWGLTGDPLDFARVATRVTEGVSLKQSVGMADFVTAIAGYLGGWLPLGLATIGIVMLLRRGQLEGRLIVGVTAWLALGYGLAARIPVLEVDIGRYFVPLTGLLAALIPLAATALPKRGLLREGAALAALVLLASLNLGTIRAQANEARLEPGLMAASTWLAQCAPHLRTLSTHRAPAVQLAAGYRQVPVHLLNSRWNTDAPKSMEDELNAKGAQVLVLVGAGPEVQEFRASKIRGWSYAWQDQEVVIYARVSAEEHGKLLTCGR